MTKFTLPYLGLLPRSHAFQLCVAAVFCLLAGTKAQAADPDWPQLVAKAYEYGFPLFEQAQLCYNFSYSPQNPGRVPVNHFGARRRLADYTSRAATTPNNDTLYSSAVIDLSAGPVEMDIPDFGTRYFAVALLDSYTNDFSYVSTRTGASKGGRYLIVGPSWSGAAPTSTHIIHAPSDHIIALARIFVSGPEDYSIVHQLQDELLLRSSVPTRFLPVAPLPDDPVNFVAVVNQVLHENPPPKADEPILKRLSLVGIGPDVPPLSDQQLALWRRHFDDARNALIAESRQLGPRDAGWEYIPADVGNFGTDYKTRAMIALRGIWASVPDELLYTIAVTDRAGVPLNGDDRYVLHLPAQAPPAAFWSLSVYEVTLSGEFFFGQNPIQRYALSNLTSDLAHNQDGSVDIQIQRDPPVGSEKNWLPIPAPHFALIMRAYLPGAALRDGQFRYPGLVRAAE